MNLLTAENISKSYGELVLFSNISFGINQNQKIALIAKNGSGKTSILNILSGKRYFGHRKDIPAKRDQNCLLGTRTSVKPKFDY